MKTLATITFIFALLNSALAQPIDGGHQHTY
jgi:hypothetical protein